MNRLTTKESMDSIEHAQTIVRQYMAYCRHLPKYSFRYNFRGTALYAQRVSQHIAGKLAGRSVSLSTDSDTLENVLYVGVPVSYHSYYFTASSLDTPAPRTL
jgi:hypothetical protein